MGDSDDPEDDVNTSESQPPRTPSRKRQPSTLNEDNNDIISEGRRKRSPEINVDKLKETLKEYQDQLRIKNEVIISLENENQNLKETSISQNDFDDVDVGVTGKFSWVLPDSELNDLHQELEETELRGGQISDTLAALQKQLEDGAFTPPVERKRESITVSTPVTGKAINGVDPAMQEEANRYLQASKLIEDKATKQLKSDLQKAYQKNF
eukprot:UN30191